MDYCVCVWGGGGGGGKGYVGTPLSNYWGPPPQLPSPMLVIDCQTEKHNKQHILELSVIRPFWSDLVNFRPVLVHSGKVLSKW